MGRTPVGQEWKRQGENVLERAAVQKSLNFARDWGERLLSVSARRARHCVLSLTRCTQGKDPAQALAAAQLYGTDARNGAGRVGWN